MNECKSFHTNAHIYSLHLKMYLYSLHCNIYACVCTHIFYIQCVKVILGVKKISIKQGEENQEFSGWQCVVFKELSWKALQRLLLSRELKEMREGIHAFIQGRAFQGEEIANTKALRWNCTWCERPVCLWQTGLNLSVLEDFSSSEPHVRRHTFLAMAQQVVQTRSSI